MAGGHAVDPMVGSPGLRISPHSSVGEGDQETTTGSGSLDPDSSSLASAAMVSRTAGASSRTPSETVPEPTLSHAAQKRSASRQPAGPRPARMAAVQRSLRALGASEQSP